MAESQIYWQTFETDDLSIQLPGTFIGGNPKKDKEKIQRDILKLPKKYHPGFSGLLTNTSFPFAAVDGQLDDSFTFFTSLTASSENLPLLRQKMTLEEYVKQVQKRLGKNMLVQENTLIKIGSYSAARLLIADRKMQGLIKKPAEIQRKVLMFCLKLPKTFWSFAYSAMPEKFEELIPIFEKSIHSVKIKKE